MTTLSEAASKELLQSYGLRQDERYAEAIVQRSVANRTPVIAATGFVIADPSNPGPATLRKRGHPCYGSPREAVSALAALSKRGGPGL